jgi:two-component system LytT family response regulator
MRIIYVDSDLEAQSQFAEAAGSSNSIKRCTVYSSPHDALTCCKNEQVDLAFVEIDLPRNGGIWLANELRQIPVPCVFVSSVNDHAAEAFDLQVLHFLIKPINPADIEVAILRFKKYLRIPSLEHLEKKLNDLIWEKQQRESERWLLIKNRNKISVLEYSSILYLEGAGSYTHIHTSDGKRLTTSKLLRTYEEQLKQHPDFIRIHKSYIVNRNYIQSVSYNEHKSLVMLKNEIELEMSVKLRDRIVQLIFNMS